MINGIIKCLVLCPNAQDATSFYRAAGPFAVMRKQFPIEFTYASQVDWPLLSNHDMVFFQRPFNESHLRVFDAAKDMNIPTWVDYDDDILNIPKTNPAYAVFQNNKGKTIIERADLLTVSTPQLAETYGKFRKDKTTKVISNGIMVPMKTEPSQKREHPVVLWRGSPSHIGDTSILTKWLSHPKFAKAKIHAVGFLPPDIADDPRVEHMPWIQLFDFYKYINHLAPNYIVVPLADNLFNDCKSNIAWLEGLSCGAVTLASPVREFRHVSFEEYVDMPTDDAFYKQLAMANKYGVAELNFERFKSVCDLLGLKITEDRKTA